jgi:hypothetical protein
VLLALLAIAGAPAVVRAAMPMHACHDACLTSARGAYRQCTSSAMGAFQDAVSGCIERQHECVQACRTQRRDCRDLTGTAAELAQCDMKLETDVAKCTAEFPLVPKQSRMQRARCISKAQIANFRCHNEVMRRALGKLAECHRAFDQCTNGCPAGGGPPGGSGACKAQGRTAFRSVLADCTLTFRATSRGCINRDVTCVQDCGDARLACQAPTEATLQAALATCATTSAAAISACHAANPGGAGLQKCITAAQANAAACGDAAVQAAAPGLAACVEPFVSCVHACPRPGETP